MTLKKHFTIVFLLHILTAYSVFSQRKHSVQSTLNLYKDSIHGFGIVALVDNGKNIDVGTVGYSYKSVPIADKNRFCIGSVTKTFTAVIILKLQEKGLLNINDSIYRYIPKHKFIDSTITIKQLLNHTSGLTDILKNGFLNAPFFDPYGDYSDKVLYSKIDTIDFVKGSRYSYCNTNYFLLAKIIERVTDKSYETNLQELIFNPLGLKNTFPYHSNSIDNLAHPIIDGQDLQKYPKRANSILSQGSGNIVSDIYDLNKFIRALLIDKTLLKSETLQLMTDFFSYKNTKTGLGLFEEKHGNRIMLGHTGRQISYITNAFVDQKTKESIIVINNNANDEYIDKVFEKICEQK
jgi:CubicO group peptidase (beta-lactamase class C family)